MGYPLKKSIWLSEIAEYLHLEMIGENRLINNISNLPEALETSLTFSVKTYDVSIQSNIISPLENCSPERSNVSSFLLSTNPRLDFIRAIEYLTVSIGFTSYEFESIVHPSVTYGKNVVVESGCVIEEGTIIEHNVVIHKGTRLGKNTRIRTNSSIGGDGFGFERLADGTPIRFPHLGGVIIGSNVEIGANNCIARGTLSDTIIEDNVKTDNLVHIAHNCQIKNGVFITACAEISGGVTIGEQAWIAPNVSIIQKVKIGEKSLVGIGAVVTKDVEANSVVAGNPARKLNK